MMKAWLTMLFAFSLGIACAQSYGDEFYSSDTAEAERAVQSFGKMLRDEQDALQAPQLSANPGWATGFNDHPAEPISQDCWNRLADARISIIAARITFETAQRAPEPYKSSEVAEGNRDLREARTFLGQASACYANALADLRRRGPGGEPGVGDPFLTGLGDGFKECGEGYRKVLLDVPVLLLSGNFVQAARLLGVSPGESVVLKALVQELNQPVIGTEQTPYEVGRRIGRRICSYGLSVGIESQGAAGSRPRAQIKEPIVQEPIFQRRPSPTSFKDVNPDSVKQHVFDAPSHAWTPEEIGELGMAAEAKDRGYWALLPPEKASRTPQGFDGIYWDPKSGAIVIAEAKGGYNGAPLDNILDSGYGVRQGTIDWAEKAAQRVTRALRTNDAEVRYAEQILTRVLKDGKVPVRVEVFHTEFIQGRPGVTRHYITDSLP